MAKVLFTSTQGMGHFRPLLPFITSAVDVGHDVTVVVPEALAAAARLQLPDGAVLRVGADPEPDELDAVWGRVHGASKEEAEQLVIGEIFGRLKAIALLPEVREAIAVSRPDLVIHESAEFAGPAGADESGVPHATVEISQARSFFLDVATPTVEAWAPGAAERVRSSPHLTVFPASVDADEFADTRRVRVEPAPANDLPAFWPEAKGPLVYVTFGTVTRDTPPAIPAYRVALQAVADLPVRVLMTTGGDVPGLPSEPPPNVHIAAWVPQGDVLPHAKVVVGHGGSGTTLGALAAGVPSVIVPLFADQPQNAEMIERAGAGVAVPAAGDGDRSIRALGDDDVPRIRAAVEQLLADHRYRARAQTIAQEMQALPPIVNIWTDLLSLPARRR